MKGLFLYIKEQMKKPKWIIMVSLSLIAIITLSFLGVMKYIMVILIIVAFIWISKDGKKDNAKLLSPAEREKRDEEYNEIQNKIEIIQEHIQNNPNDLEAKLKLEAANKEFAEFLEKYNLK